MTMDTSRAPARFPHFRGSRHPAPPAGVRAWSRPTSTTDTISAAVPVGAEASSPATDDPTSEAYRLRHNYLARKPETKWTMPIAEKISNGLGIRHPAE